MPHRTDSILGRSHTNIDKAYGAQKTAAEMGSSPVQETDTEFGGMTATGSKTRRSKRVLSKPRTTSREKASRPRASENTNTLRVYKALKKKK